MQLNFFYHQSYTYAEMSDFGLQIVDLKTPNVRLVIQGVRLLHVTRVAAAADHARRIGDAGIAGARHGRHNRCQSAVRSLLHYRAHRLHRLRWRRWLRLRQCGGRRGDIVHRLHYVRA